MRRRDFIWTLGATTVWPVTAHAQQVLLPVVGFLSGRSLASDATLVRAFRDGLSDAGYVEGRNVKIEFRWADGRPEKLPQLAGDLLAQHASVIFAGAADNGIHEIQEVLSEIPVVFATGGDPVALGIATTLAHPGGNVTGMTVMTAALWPKRLAFLRELTGQGDLIAVLIDPANDTATRATADIEAAAKSVGQEIVVVEAKSEGDFEAVFSAVGSERAHALLVSDDAVFINGRKKLIALAARYGVPTIYGRREFAFDGGLAAYGAITSDQYHQCGLYAGRILNGAKPRELPFLQPTRFELVINLKTARSLGLSVPQILLVTADEVIE